MSTFSSSSPSASAAPARSAPIAKKKKSAAVPETPETSILNHAGQALARGDAAGALAMTRDLARAFPKGRLMEERDYVAIKALIALGQRDEAARRFERFCSAYPQSLFRDELAQAISQAPQNTKAPESSR